MAWVLITLIVAVLIVRYEVPKMKKKRQSREIGIFFFLLVVGTALSIAEGLRLKIPDPLDWITAIYAPVSRMFAALFA